MKSAGEIFLSGLRGAKHFSNAFRIVFRFSRFSNRFSYRFKSFSGAVSFCTRAALTNCARNLRKIARTSLCASDQEPRKTWNGNVQANVRANNPEQCEGTTHENMGFRDNRAQKVHPNFATNIAMEFHDPIFYAPDQRKGARNCCTFVDNWTLLCRYPFFNAPFSEFLRSPPALLAVSCKVPPTRKPHLATGMCIFAVGK